MALRYTAERDGDVLFVSVTGSDEGIHEVRQYVLDIIKTAFDKGVQRILCDETAIATRLDTLETFEIGTFIAKQLPPSFRIAILYDPASLFDFRFFESIVVNRGIQMRIFTDQGAAKNWLAEGENPNMP
ncbi:MAG: hypothetical protein HGA26_01635 [Chlorobiaceae bacterium]|nr:hypothetical protein [Chlorobiaceae bacterium]